MEQLQMCGIDPQSYFLLKSGLKPVIRIGTTKNELDYLVEFVNNYKVFNIIKKFDNKFYGEKLEKPILIAYVSLSQDLAEEAYEAEKNQDRKTLGKLLGYPSCCVDNFIKKCADFNTEFTIESFLNTKVKPSFYCNSVFNFDSKLNRDSVRVFQKIHKIFLDTEYFFLVKHIPCSFDCKETIEIGKRTLEILEKETPEIAQKILSTLKKPVLYFDYFSWIVFDGYVRDNTLFYSKVLPYKSLFPEIDLKIIKEGNKFEIFDDKINVYKDNKILLTIEKQGKYRGIILDFS